MLVIATLGPSISCSSNGVILTHFLGSYILLTLLSCHLTSDLGSRGSCEGDSHCPSPPPPTLSAALVVLDMAAPSHVARPPALS